jgi:hypothetical protein
VALQWSKDAKGHSTSRVGPFRIILEPRGDGRWAWMIFDGEAQNPTATGVAASVGAAKTTVEQFVNRSGRV